MHMSIPADEARDRWMRRHAANLVASGIDPADAERARRTIATELPVLTPDEDRAVLQEAGFHVVTEFFRAFTFRAWVGYA